MKIADEIRAATERNELHALVAKNFASPRGICNSCNTFSIFCTLDYGHTGMHKNGQFLWEEFWPPLKLGQTLAAVKEAVREYRRAVGETQASERCTHENGDWPYAERCECTAREPATVADGAGLTLSWKDRPDAEGWWFRSPAGGWFWVGESNGVLTDFLPVDAVDWYGPITIPPIER